jgi:hypothetical protein
MSLLRRAGARVVALFVSFVAFPNGHSQIPIEQPARFLLIYWLEMANFFLPVIMGFVWFETYAAMYTSTSGGVRPTRSAVVASPTYR